LDVISVAVRITIIIIIDSVEVSQLAAPSPGQGDLPSGVAKMGWPSQTMRGIFLVA